MLSLFLIFKLILSKTECCLTNIYLYVKYICRFRWKILSCIEQYWKSFFKFYSSFGKWYIKYWWNQERTRRSLSVYCFKRSGYSITQISKFTCNWWENVYDIKYVYFLVSLFDKSVWLKVTDDKQLKYVC